MPPSFTIAPMICCGIREMSNISMLPDAISIVRETARQMYNLTNEWMACPAFLLFTGVVQNRKRIYHTNFHADRSDNYALELADYIKANNLGTVSVSQEGTNHSGNVLQVFVWAPDWAAMKTVYAPEASLAVDTPVTFTYNMMTNTIVPIGSASPGLTVANASMDPVVSVAPESMNCGQ